MLTKAFKHKEIPMWFKVFASFFLGALIGSTVALQLNPYFWWIGMIVGALVGFISYQFNEVLRAIPVAWRRTTDWEGWKPNPLHWRAFGWCFLSYFVISLPFLFGILIIFFHQKHTPLTSFRSR